MSALELRGDPRRGDTLISTLVAPVAGSSPVRPSQAILASVASRPVDIGVSASEWRALLTSAANTLIQGPDPLIARVWTVAWPALPKPVCWTNGRSLRLPRSPVPTLVLQEASELRDGEQSRLFEWLHQHVRSTRVLVTTRCPLYPLVECGTFLEPLYYCLNPLMLTLA
jgi:hypothetical protein